MVTEFGGAIDVQSHPSEGARFTLYLPECTDAAAAPADPMREGAHGAGQRPLVVDEEPELVALTIETLRFPCCCSAAMGVRCWPSAPARPA